jgi:hypothetical protein
MLERTIQATILRDLGSLPDIRLFRNNVGMGYCGKVVEEKADLIVLSNPRRIHYGLLPDSADLIGIKKTTITPEMVGMTIGQFISLETKSLTGRVRSGQENWRHQMELMGALAGVARSTGDAKIICGVE